MRNTLNDNTSYLQQFDPEIAALIGSDTSTLVFLAFVAVMYLVVFTTIRRESRKDGPIL